MQMTVHGLKKKTVVWKDQSVSNMYTSLACLWARVCFASLVASWLLANQQEWFAHSACEVIHVNAYFYKPLDSITCLCTFLFSLE